MERGGVSVININVPVEFTISGIYLPPLLIASVIGVVAAFITAKLLNRYHLSRYFFYPPLAFVAMVVIYTLFFGYALILI
ncbi:MAG: DUF1656 domain-containing protein [Bacteroidales bacterium]|nr:DUF1656 domain-containing protein [Bacteroidales bacterium]